MQGKCFAAESHVWHIKGFLGRLEVLDHSRWCSGLSPGFVGHS